MQRSSQPNRFVLGAGLVLALGVMITGSRIRSNIKALEAKFLNWLWALDAQTVEDGTVAEILGKFNQAEACTMDDFRRLVENTTDRKYLVNSFSDDLLKKSDGDSDDGLNNAEKNTLVHGVGGGLRQTYRDGERLRRAASSSSLD